MSETRFSLETAGKRLQQDPLFQGLDTAQLREVLGAARERKVQRGSFLFHQGDPASALYVLVSGQVRMLQVTSEGQQVLLRIITPGETFGGIAVLENTTYPASAQAARDCAVLTWDGETLARLMERFPRMALNALRLLASRLQELQDRYRELATQRVERRVAQALLRLTRQTGRKVEDGVLIDFPLSREDLAELAGTTLYTVSRILSRWEREGLIETGRQRILIRSPHGLVAIAEDLTSDSPPDTA